MTDLDFSDPEAVPDYGDEAYRWSYRVIRESVDDPDVLIVALEQEPFKTRQEVEA